MTNKQTMDDGTVFISGQIVPQGGSIPTVASVVSYSGNTGLQSTNVEGALDELDNEKAPITHTHDDRYFTEVEVTNLLTGKAASNHTHDDRYFTEVEVTNLLAGKSDTSHNHDNRYYTESEVDVKIAAALATTELHENPNFDLVVLTTDGPGEATVPARLHPEAWSNFWANGTGVNAPVIESDNSVTHTPGGYSVKIVHPTNATGLALSTPPFGVAPGAVVTVSAWVRGTGPRVLITALTGPPGSNPDFFGSGISVFETSVSIPGTDWTQLSVTFVVPGNHTRCSFKLRSYADAPAGPGTIWWDDSKSSMQVIPPSGVVTGEIKMWPSGNIPAGYLLCNGGTFSATTYPALAALLGDTFGTHSGDTYYLPDFRGRIPLGPGNQFPVQQANWNISLGQKYGHVSLQQHSHGQDAHNHGGATGSSHAGTGYASVPEAYYTSTYGLIQVGSYQGRPMVWMNSDEAPHTHTISSATPGIHNAGSGDSGNIPPILGIYFIIKAA